MSDVLRVLVLGDHASGKSSLIHWLEHGGPPKRPPRPTVGCAVSVLESFSEDSGAPFVVDLREVGGHDSFTAARAVFYRDFDALVVVVDASKVEAGLAAVGAPASDHPTRPELARWLAELDVAAAHGPGHVWVAEEAGASDAEGGLGCGSRDLEVGAHHRSPNLFPLPPSRSGSGGGSCWVPRFDGGPVPALLVANKADLLAAGGDGDSCGGGGGGYFASQLDTPWEGQAALFDGGAFDAVVSAADEHFDSGPFHDFFYRALRHKQVHRKARVGVL
jgi:hypothetical protein